MPDRPYQITGIILFVVYTFLSGYALGDQKYPNALPDLRVSKGKNDIAEAWLSHPTKRYTHFVLGSSYEAGALNVRMRDGKVITYKLDRNSVFEDRYARLYDLDKDGKDEIIVVRAYLRGGAALSVFGVKAGKLKLLAETPDMGHPFGWLNPAGIADFDGDGVIEIAFVRKPHVLARLELWGYQSGKLVLKGSLSGASNHGIGSKQLGLSHVADFDGDGVMDLAVPSRNRRAIRFIRFKGDLEEISRKPLPKAVTRDFQKANGGVTVTLSDGSKVTVTP